MRYAIVSMLWMVMMGLSGAPAMAQDSNYVAGTESTTAPTEKHIYDSSERYFNQWTLESWQANPLLWPAANADKQVKQWRGKEEYWYVNKAWDFDHYIDSVLKADDDGKRKISTREVYNKTLSIPTVAEGSSAFFIGIILTIFLALLLYFMLSNKLGFFAPENVKVAGEAAEGDIEEHLFSIQYRQRLQKALQEGNYRLAVRILYLQTLRQLSDSGAIRYQPDYTNIDYLLQMRAHTQGDRYQLFSVITSHYEYVWYGKFEVSKELYERISKDFITLQNRIG